jgi:hypothetical protein
MPTNGRNAHRQAFILYCGIFRTATMREPARLRDRASRSFVKRDTGTAGASIGFLGILHGSDCAAHRGFRSGVTQETYHAVGCSRGARNNGSCHGRVTQAASFRCRLPSPRQSTRKILRFPRSMVPSAHQLFADCIDTVLESGFRREVVVLRPLELATWPRYCRVRRMRSPVDGETSSRHRLC